MSPFMSTVHSYRRIKAVSLGSNLCMTQWTGRSGTWVHGCTCRLQPAEPGSSSWPARGSDQSAGWGSGKSSESAGYFLWPLTTPPDLPPDNHLDGNRTEGQQKKITDRAEEVILLSFTTALLPKHNSVCINTCRRQHVYTSSTQFLSFTQNI